MPTPSLEPHCLTSMWVITDGTLAGNTLGGGIPFYHPQQGVLQSHSFGLQVVKATSADAEWLSKVVARHLLREWAGQAHFLAGATASMHCALTKARPAPRPLSSTICSAK